MSSDLSDVSMTVVMYVIRFVRCSDDCRNGCYPVLPSWLVAPEDPSEGCNLLGSFLWWSDVSIRPSLLFSLQGSVKIFFRCTCAIERPILTLDRLFDDEQYLTRWSNVTVHYDVVRCSCKVCTMVLRVLWM